jgi:hypothetical protein
MRVPARACVKLCVIWAGKLGLESPSQFMRLAQPIETKWRIWLRGVDLNHRPLGYETTEACQTVQEQGTTAQKTLHLASEFSAGLGWFCTPFPHISRTPESKEQPRVPNSLAISRGHSGGL